MFLDNVVNPGAQGEVTYIMAGYLLIQRLVGHKGWGASLPSASRSWFSTIIAQLQ